MSSTQYGRTALHEAAKEGHTELCRYLIEKGALSGAADKVNNNE